MWRSPFFVLVVLTSALASPDLSVKTVTRIADPNATPDPSASRARLERLYLQGHNRRQESLRSLEPGLTDFSFATPRLVIIDRCDEGLEYQLNPATREYIRIRTSPSSPATFSRLRWRIGRKDVPKTEPATYASLDSETEDTGETQEVFGQIAHHFITRTRRKPTVGSGLPESLLVADGWFVASLSIAAACPLQKGGAWPPSASGHDDFLGGPKPLGMPVRVKYTSNFTTTSAEGNVETQTLVRESEVVELSDKPLASTLFEVPKGYKRVKHFRRARPAKP